MTMTEKILAAHVGRPEVRPGELIDCTVDFLFERHYRAAGDQGVREDGRRAGL